MRLKTNYCQRAQLWPRSWASFILACLVLGLNASSSSAQVEDFAPVTEAMLLDPSPNDWLMFSRTYDNQRFSPLDQINRRNVADLDLVWARGLSPGVHEHIPLVYHGVLYVANPGAIIQALDATNGDLIWEYRRRLPRDIGDFIPTPGIARTLAIYEDFIYYTAPDGYVVALDASTGRLRWETMAHDYKTRTRHTSGPIVAEGKVFTGRSCRTRSGCFISAHDARTGEEVWKFFTTAGPGEPGGDTWGDLALSQRLASPWGLPGAYDPARGLLYWGVANPRPYTRRNRHGGELDAVPRSAPSELYSNSTVALEAATGKLAWYYQHLPGDDWDGDHTQERIILQSRFNPDPRAVKWINPRIIRGQEREMVVSVGEPGGIWVLDPTEGRFLWSSLFPFDVPNVHTSHIDVETGKTYLNPDLLLEKDGDRHIICFEDTKSYWPMAYYPQKNSLYIPYHDSCLDVTGSLSSSTGHEIRTAIPRPGSDPEAFAGIAKVDMSTGRIRRLYTQPFPGNGAVLATAGNLIFWGDANRRFRALDADSGAILWEAVLGGIIQMSTITFAVAGKQYLAVLTGDGVGGTRRTLAQVSGLQPPRGHNATYVFALH